MREKRLQYICEITQQRNMLGAQFQPFPTNSPEVRVAYKGIPVSGVFPPINSQCSSCEICTHKDLHRPPNSRSGHPAAFNTSLEIVVLNPHSSISNQFHLTMAPQTSTSKLASSRVLILGGTGGIGISLTRALIEHKARVILSSSRQAKVNAVISALKTNYPDAIISGHACDLASQDVEANIKALFEQVDEIDHIVYMAGDRLPMVPLEDVTLAKWQSANQVRTISALLVCKIGTQYMKKSRDSSIVLTGGSISEKPIAGGWSMLACIGAGINGMTRQLAFDVAPIRVNCVAPGVVETDLWSGMGEEGQKRFLSGHQEMMPTGRVGQPSDLAEAYLYCLKDRNATGSVVHSNSGAFLV